MLRERLVALGVVPSAGEGGLHTSSSKLKDLATEPQDSQLIAKTIKTVPFINIRVHYDMVSLEA